MKKLKFFFLYFICLQASAQSTLIATQVKSYQVDRLDNVLYIDLKSNITKIESTRLKTNHYAALASGSPEILDATNPFAIMVFYPSFFQVKILDVNLAEKDVTGKKNIYDNITSDFESAAKSIVDITRKTSQWEGSDIYRFFKISQHLIQAFRR